MKTPVGPSKTAIGGGGFVKPGGVSGAKNILGGGSKTAIGGGGFVKPGTPKHYSYPKVNSYPSPFISKPVSTFSKTPGYGTAFGTKFTPTQRYTEKKGFSKKALGLGVGAGFVGGAAVGVAGTAATYGAYHKYKKFKNMMRMRGFHHRRSHHHGLDFDDDDDDYFFGNNYETNYYNRNECMGGCPLGSHCEWGICECNYNYRRTYGRCIRRTSGKLVGRSPNFDPFIQCADHKTCQNMDMNLVCNTNLTVQAGGKCQCKPDMKWNKDKGECQIYLDVDCSAITYDTPPAENILKAIEADHSKNQTAATPVDAVSPSNTTTAVVNPSNTTTTAPTQTDSSNNTTTATTTATTTVDDLTTAPTVAPSVTDSVTAAGEVKTEAGQAEEDLPPADSRTPTINESLKTSLLSKIDSNKATADEMREAFCRDIDAYSFDLNEYDGKPPGCESIKKMSICAVMYDSGDCSGGWTLYVDMGHISFPYFSSYWKYRNDVDLVGVRAGCTFTGYSSTGFSGKRETIVAGDNDVWIELKEHSRYRHLHEDIESVSCNCRWR